MTFRASSAVISSASPGSALVIGGGGCPGVERRWWPSKACLLRCMVGGGLFVHGRSRGGAQVGADLFRSCWERLLCNW